MLSDLMDFSTFMALGAPAALPNLYWDAYSNEERIKRMCLEIDGLKRYADAIVADIEAGGTDDIEKEIALLAKSVEALRYDMYVISRNGSRSPIDGSYAPLYSILKQMYDLLRTRSMTWASVAATGKTWNELAATGKTYLDFDVNANEILGDNTETLKYTSAEGIDTDTPGYGN